MPQDIPAKSGVLPHGVFVVGRAVGDFTLRSGISAKGKPYQFVEGKILAGTTFVKVNESIDLGSIPLVPKDGDDVRAAIVPGFKANGILAVDIKLARPEMAVVSK